MVATTVNCSPGKVKVLFQYLDRDSLQRIEKWFDIKMTECHDQRLWGFHYCYCDCNCLKAEPTKAEF